MKRKSSHKKPAKKPKEKALAVIEEEHNAFEGIEISKEVLADPRKVLFFRVYFDRESPTYGNMKQSAIVAGFEETYAHNMTALKPKWLYDFIGQQDFVQLAETHLREVLMLPNIVQAMGAFGPIFKKEIIKVEKKYKNGKTRMVNQKVQIPVMVPNPSIIKEKTAAAKIVLPAHDAKYKPKDGPKNAFFFNVQQARERYNGNNNARVSKNN